MLPTLYYMLNIDELLRNVVPSDAPMSLRAIQDEIRVSVEEKYIQKLIKFLDSGTHLLCKNPIGKMFQIKYDDCVIFQRMTTDEILVAYAIDAGGCRPPATPCSHKGGL
jgi:hypothetical protein